MIAHEVGQGRPLVLVHGFELDHRSMLPLDASLAEGPWRRIYLDLPWTAQAVPGSVASAQEVADGVVNELRQLLGEEPFAIIGHSFGGMIARHVAHTMRSQVLGLATLGAVFTADHNERVLPAPAVIRADLPEQVVDGDFLGIAVIQTPDTLAAFNEFVLPGLRGTDPQVTERIAADYALQREPEQAYPEPFEAPSLHIFGRQDHVTGYEDGLALRDHYVRGTFAVLDAAGHHLYMERPAVVSALVNDWLASIAAPSPALPR
ncbi:alpha/beta hydrolase [Arthrobacter zhangbolii]|uniref:Alpha/beta hydrolase n=1 Tax=Arthrobacter zhangbolii TaxID=2886936 RepID=A0A9X1SBY5_9MICC|nr:alpha/beta hydrolase [Arthrobacter zhangbolii]MCC3273344.1 alpha/beta hydrolase [Arthrobacter zhangbolii]UON92677.1 alpha/beta hydrolase [Arthrobacter zhangbolii]